MRGCVALSGLGIFFATRYPGLHPGLSHYALAGLGSSLAVSFLEFSSESLVQQRLLQRLQGGELPLVEAGEGR